MLKVSKFKYFFQASSLNLLKIIYVQHYMIININIDRKFKKIATLFFIMMNYLEELMKSTIIAWNFNSYIVNNPSSIKPILHSD